MKLSDEKGELDRTVDAFSCVALLSQTVTGAATHPPSLLAAAVKSKAQSGIVATTPRPFRRPAFDSKSG
jgi:hypothetical protein